MRYIAVLGNDFDYQHNRLGPGTQNRCLRAIDRARALISGGESVTVLCAAGRNERMPAGTTISSHMEAYIKTANLPVKFQVNHFNEEVWGTVKEIKWIYERLADMGETEESVQFVTNKLQARRVRLIAKRFYGRDVEFASSNDTTPLRHEVLAYGKLLAYLFGLGEFVEKVRRKLYHEW